MVVRLVGHEGVDRHLVAQLRVADVARALVDREDAAADLHLVAGVAEDQVVVLHRHMVAVTLGGRAAGAGGLEIVVDRTQGKGREAQDGTVSHAVSSL